MTQSTNPNSETVEMNLDHDHNINGVQYKAGQRVSVPRNVAEQVDKNEHGMNKTEADYAKKRTSNVNAGTIAMGGN